MRPGDADFIIDAAAMTDKSYNASGVAAGNHDFKAVDRNSKGVGPASDVSAVSVG